MTRSKKKRSRRGMLSLLSNKEALSYLSIDKVNIRFMVETRGQQRRRIKMKLEQLFMENKEEESSLDTPPRMEANDPEYEEYKKF
ncbi:hypothetical protein EJ110_NYTH23705 [Nymphaea thermarum]|nr:hypothetical protein EJ110_NYTH23705 [Nymphaea thermarum]